MPVLGLGTYAYEAERAGRQRDQQNNAHIVSPGNISRAEEAEAVPYLPR